MSNVTLFIRAFGATVVVIGYEIGNIPTRWWLTMLTLAVIGNLLMVIF